MNRPIAYSQSQQCRNAQLAARQRFQELGTPWQWFADVLGGIGLIFTIVAMVILASVLIS